VNKRTKDIVVGAGILTAICGGLTACDGSIGGGGTFKDVKGINPQNAGSYTLINNADKFPNIVIVCYKGVAFTTTTREAAGAILRVPELDKTCPGYVAPAPK
jgi:hypothetical protein